jgi:tyrosine-protein kinase Etk/Wzc
MATEYTPAKEHDSTAGPLSFSTIASRDKEISVLDILLALAERKLTIFWITTITAVVALVVSLLLPKKFTATATILPPQQNSSIGASMLASQLGSIGGIAALAGGSLGIKNPNDMFVAMMKSRTVEDSMVQRFGLRQEYKVRYLSDARKVLERHVTIDDGVKDGLIRISIEDRDPNRAAELANGYVDQFRRLSEHLAITEASQRRLFFEQQLEQAKDRLASAEEAMEQTERQTGIIQLSSQTQALIESATSIRAQIAAKEVQIQSLQTFATDQNAQLVQAQQELASLRFQLAKLGGSEGGTDASLIVPKGKVPQASLEYIRRLRDVKYYETIFDILARQFETAKLDEARQGALIQVVDAAVPPDRRSSPKRALIVLSATVFGFIAGIFTAIIRTAFRRMMEQEETSRKLQLLRRMLSF